MFLSNYLFVAVSQTGLRYAMGVNMIETFRTVYNKSVCEITEKKSRFIATVHPVESEEAALGFIEQVRKQYPDANHNCFAYVLGLKDEIQRCSDDGEPARTAGRPILDVLLGDKLHNVLVIVTRYFGGTLLGTGGLVRAYQRSAKEGLKKCIIIDKNFGIKIQVTTDYYGIGKLLYIITQMGIITLSSEYTDIVIVELLIPIKIYEDFQVKVREATAGSVQILDQGSCYYGEVSGKVIVFDS